MTSLRQIVREVTDDGSQYFGPFRSQSIVRETVDYLQHVLPLRKCTRKNPRCRPCIYYQLGKCAAPPLGGEHRVRHHEAIDQLVALLDGMSDDLLAWLEQKRDILAGALMFERAAEVQERIEALRDLIKRQVILEAAVRQAFGARRRDSIKNSHERQSEKSEEPFGAGKVCHVYGLQAGGSSVQSAIR